MTAQYVGVCKALYEYAAQTDDELDLKEDDLLYILENEDPEWWKAKKKPDDPDDDGPIGLVPSNYVETAEPIAVVKALYDYVAQTDEELNFKEDQVAYVFDRDDPDWWYVRIGDTYGYIPSNYVEESTAAEAPPEQDQSTMFTAIQAPQAGEYVDPIASKARADDIKTWPVSEVDKKKKKKKGTLGVGNGTILFASEADKTPVQQWPITELLSFSQEKKHVFVEFTGAKATAFDFHAGSKDAAEAIMNKIKQCQELAAPSTPATNGHSRATSSSNVVIPPPPPLPGTAPTVPITNRAVAPEPNPEPEYEAEPEYQPEPEPEYEEAEPEAEAESETVPAPIAAVIPSHGQSKRGIAVYDFDAQGDDELTVRADQELEVIDDVSSEEWWKCRIGDQEGVVPASYIELQAGKPATNGVSDTDAEEAAAASASAAAAATAAAAAEAERRRKSGAATAAAAAKKQQAAAAAEVERKRREQARIEAEAVQKRKEEEARQRVEAEEERRKKKQVAQENGPPSVPKLPPTRPRPSAADDQAVKNIATPKDRHLPERPAQAQSKSKPMPSNTRTWIDNTGGFKVEAEFLGYHDGKIHLHKLNGVKIAVPMSKMSPEDIAYVEKLMGKSLTSRSAPAAAPSTAPRPAATPSRPQGNYDWFDFFLQCGIDVDDCSRYASAFTADKMDESVLTGITHDTMRTLGLKEGDILRVSRHLEKVNGRGPSVKKGKGVSFGDTSIISEDDDEAIARRMQAQEAISLRKQQPSSRNASQIAEDEDFARRLQEEENRGSGSNRRGRPTANRLEPTSTDLQKSLQSVVQKQSTPPPRLFAQGAGGVLKNNTRKPRANSLAESNGVSATNEQSMAVSSPMRNGQADSNLGFEDDAWAVKPSPARAPQQQTVGELSPSLATAMLQPTQAPTPAPPAPTPPPPPSVQNVQQLQQGQPIQMPYQQTGQQQPMPIMQQPVQQPSSPVNIPPRQRPLSPAKKQSLQQQQAGLLGMAQENRTGSPMQPMMTGQMPQMMSQMPSMSIPQMNGSNMSMAPQSTGMMMQSTVPQSMPQIQPQLQSMQSMPPQMTGYQQQQMQLQMQQQQQMMNASRPPPIPVPANEALLKPLIPTNTGMNTIVPTRMNQQATGLSQQPTGFQPQQTGYQPGFQGMQAQQHGFMNAQQTLQLQSTGMRANLAAASPLDPFGTGAMKSNMTGGQFRPNYTGSVSPPPTTSSPNQFQPANVFASMKTGSLTSGPSPDRYSALRQADSNAPSIFNGSMQGSQWQQQMQPSQGQMQGQMPGQITGQQMMPQLTGAPQQQYGNPQMVPQMTGQMTGAFNGQYRQY